MMGGLNGKECTKCGKYRKLDEFYRSKTDIDGRKTICKKCSDKQTKISRADPNYKQRLVEDQTKYLQENKSKECTKCKKPNVSIHFM